MRGGKPHWKHHEKTPAQTKYAERSISDQEGHDILVAVCRDLKRKHEIQEAQERRLQELEWQEQEAQEQEETSPWTIIREQTEQKVQEPEVQAQEEKEEEEKEIEGREPEEKKTQLARHRPHGRFI